MGALIVKPAIHDAFMAAAAERAIEFPHGYTYSAHPLACAASVATLDLYRDEGLFQRAANLAPRFEEKAHALRGTRHIKDIRNLGLVAGIELDSRPGAPGARGMDVFLKCWEKGVLVRFTGDIIAVSPPLIISEAEIDRLFATIGEAIHEAD
jgi:beta-alanine--pyruvate transaminase